MREILKPKGDFMRLNCTYCGELLISHSRPMTMTHKSETQQIFKSYLHCANCGATTNAEVTLKICRPAFKQSDLLESTA